MREERGKEREGEGREEREGLGEREGEGKTGTYDLL